MTTPTCPIPLQAKLLAGFHNGSGTCMMQNECSFPFHFTLLVRFLSLHSLHCGEFASRKKSLDSGYHSQFTPSCISRIHSNVSSISVVELWCRPKAGKTLSTYGRYCHPISCHQGAPAPCGKLPFTSNLARTVPLPSGTTLWHGSSTDVQLMVHVVFNSIIDTEA